MSQVVITGVRFSGMSGSLAKDHVVNRRKNTVSRPAKFSFKSFIQTILIALIHTSDIPIPTIAFKPSGQQHPRLPRGDHLYRE